MHSTTVAGAAVYPQADREEPNFRFPRITVVIPCYNLGNYLGEAIESVRAQTLQEWEIIVVDDGSTDLETLAVLEELTREGIEVVHTPNRGPASARNEGIGRARGAYILPLDADDRIAPTYLENAVAVLDADPEVGILYGQVELFGDARGIWQQPDYSLKRLLTDNMIVASAVFRRSDWKRVGGFRKCMVYGWEDWDFWLTLVELNRKVVRLPEVVFYYRIRSGSRTTRMGFWKNLRMFFNLVRHHKKLYLTNFALVLRHFLLLGKRRVTSPRA